MILENISNYEGECIVEEHHSFTFEDLSNKIEQYGDQLKQSIKDSDVVVIDSDYSFHSIALLLDCAH